MKRSTTHKQDGEELMWCDVSDHLRCSPGENTHEQVFIFVFIIILTHFQMYFLSLLFFMQKLKRTLAVFWHLTDKGRLQWPDWLIIQIFEHHNTTLTFNLLLCQNALGFRLGQSKTSTSIIPTPVFISPLSPCVTSLSPLPYSAANHLL